MGRSTSAGPVADPTGDAEPCVALVPIFAGLSQAQQRDVARFARPQVVDKGAAVFLMGQPQARLIVVHEGRVKVTRTSEAGRETIVGVLGPGEVAGELPFLTGARPESDVIALERTRLCTFAHADLAGLVRRFPDIGVGMLKAVAFKLGSAERMLAAFAAADVGARVAAYLLDAPTTWGPKGTATVHLPIAKKDVAAHLGTSPETLSRSLAEFERTGLVHVHGADIDIVDPAALGLRARGT